mmetsp:Transcript_54513/g.65746  ORF Transcript_54513/g.65746 Transcript_54513/m.65746 type:complete len:98 (+) Transcript_54513:521-814(+)
MAQQQQQQQQQQQRSSNHVVVTTTQMTTDGIGSATMATVCEIFSQSCVVGAGHAFDSDSLMTTVSVGGSITVHQLPRSPSLVAPECHQALEKRSRGS